MKHWTEKLIEEYIQRMINESTGSPEKKGPPKLSVKEAESIAETMVPEQRKRAWDQAKRHIRHEQLGKGIHPITRFNIIRIGKAASRAMKKENAISASALPETTPVQFAPSSSITVEDPATGSVSVLSPKDQERLRISNAERVAKFEAAATERFISPEERKRRERVKKSEKKRTSSRPIEENWVNVLKEEYKNNVLLNELRFPGPFEHVRNTRITGLLDVVGGDREHAEDYVNAAMESRDENEHIPWDHPTVVALGGGDPNVMRTALLSMKHDFVQQHHSSYAQYVKSKGGKLSQWYENLLNRRDEWGDHKDP